MSGVTPSKKENLSYLVSKIGRSQKKVSHAKKQTTQLTKPIESVVPSNYDDEIVKSEFFGGRKKARKHRRKNVDKVKQEEMLKKAQFGSDFGFQEGFRHESCRPLTEFFTNLIPRLGNYQEDQNYVSTSKLHMLIPYTVVFGVDEYPILYYTGKDGTVVRVDNVTTPQVIKKLTFECGPEDLAVVQKNPLTGESVTNNAILLNTKQLKTTLENQSRGKVVFQRYVKSKGPKATITRICWCREKPSYGYQVSNKKSFDDPAVKEAIHRLLTNSEDPTTLNLFFLKEPAIKELVKQVEHLVLYTEKYHKPKVRFSEFVCDFIRDDVGNWWFIQVKGFKFQPKTKKFIPQGTLNVPGRPKRSRANYMKLKHCKMCLNLYPPHDLSFKMTMKMIYASESHLKQRGVKLPWFDRPEFNSVSDTSMWYEPHSVCKNCFDMYIQEQKLSKVEVEFAKAIGIPVNEKANECASILTTLSAKLNTSRKEKKSIIASGKNKEIPKNLNMYRFITYLNDIRKIPDIVPDKFSLRMKIFQNELIIPLKMEVPDHRKVLPIGKLRVYYFFVPDDEAFRKWLNEYQHVTVNLYAGDERLGFANMNLSQFGSGLIDKLDYMVLFSSPKLKLCSLRATLGFVKMKPMDLSNVGLEPWGGIYIPPDDFFTAHPLPEEWMEIIPSLSAQLPIDKLAKMDPTLRKQKSKRPSTAPAGFRRTDQAEQGGDDVLSFEEKSVPISESRVLQIRSVSKKRRKSLGFKGRPLTSKGRRTNQGLVPLSKLYSPIYSSRLPMTPSKHTRKMIYAIAAGTYNSETGEITSPTSPQKHSPKKTSRKAAFQHTEKKEEQIAEEGEAQQTQEGEVSVPSAIQSDEIIWSFNISIGDVFDLKASMDESWTMKFSLFGTSVHREFESFQLLEDGPLNFDINETLFMACTETNLMSYFGKERVFKLILHPKYNPDDERVAALDLRQFLKADNISNVVVIEKISADKIDNTRFMEDPDEEEDEVSDAEDDGEDAENLDDQNEEHATVKIVMKIKKGIKLNNPFETSRYDPFEIKILDHEH